MSDPPKQRLAKVLFPALADDGSQALREQVAREVPAVLASNGLRLLIHHELAPNAAGVGFATTTLMAAELGDGAHRLYSDGLQYPGAALVRQLIECGYLLALMSENRDEAAKWMRSSHDDIVRQFMPRHIRKRAVRNFRSTEYENHCDHGGHPNPAGRMLLTPSTGLDRLSSRVRWLDLAQHLSDVWECFVAALPLYDPRTEHGDALYAPSRSPDDGERIRALLAEWREADHAALTASVPEMETQLA